MVAVSEGTIGFVGDFNIDIVEGRSVFVTISDFSSSGSTAPPDQIVFTLVETPPPMGGPFPAFVDNPGVPVSSFTQQDLDEGRVVFTHGGAEETVTSLEICVESPGDGAAIETLLFNVAPANDGPAAFEEFFATDEDTILSGDLFEFDPAARDFGNSGVDPDGDLVTVVNVINLADQAVVPVGVPTQLASGAFITVNADGSMEYDPNGAFEDLIEPFEEALVYTVDDGLPDTTVDLGTPVLFPGQGIVFTIDADLGLGKTEFFGGESPPPLNGLRLIMDAGGPGLAVTVVRFENGSAEPIAPVPFELLNYAGGLSAVVPETVRINDDVTNGTLIVRAPVRTASGEREFEITVDDFSAMSVSMAELSLNGSAFGEISSSASALAIIEVNPVNDAPEVSDQAVPDRGLPGTAIALTNLFISDADDFGSQEFLVELTVTDGTLTLGAANGLFILEGADNSDRVVVSGLLDDINLALDGLTFTPEPAFTGIARLGLLVDDMGNGGSPGPLITTVERDIIVQPENGTGFIILEQGTDFSGQEDMFFPVPGIRIDTVGEGLFELKLAVNDGAIRVGPAPASIEVIEPGGPVPGVNNIIILRGQAVDLNPLLSNLSYLGPSSFSTSDLLEIQISNIGGGEPFEQIEAVGLEIVPRNDAPEIITAFSNLTIAQNSPLIINGPQIVDEEAEFELLEVAVVVTADVGDVVPLVTDDVIVDVQPGSLSLTGLVADVNVALNAFELVLPPDFIGRVQLEILADDLGNSGPGGPMTADAVVLVDVVPEGSLPTIALTEGNSFSTAEDTPVAIPGVVLGDFEAAQNGQLVQLDIVAVGGFVTFGDLTGVELIDDPEITSPVTSLVGTLVDLNRALSGLQYQGFQDFNGPSEILFVLDDRGGSGFPGPGVVQEVIAIDVAPVDDPPLFLTDPNVEQFFIAGQPVPVFGLFIVDPDNRAVPPTLAVSLSTEVGQLNFGPREDLTTVNISGNGTGEISLLGEIDEINELLSDLVVVADPGVIGNGNLTIIAEDLSRPPTPQMPDPFLTRLDLPLIIDPSSTMLFIDDRIFQVAETGRRTDFLLSDMAGDVVDENGNVLDVVLIDGQPVGNGVEVSLVSGALVSITSDGAFTYDPNNAFTELEDGEFATDTFVFSVIDGVGGETDALATFTILGSSPIQTMGSVGVDQIVGGPGDDLIETMEGNDLASGGGGNDVVLVGDGNDYGRGGTGNDTVMGGSGRDALFGDRGQDMLRGGVGNDRLYGLADNDVLRGGAGNDVVAGGNGNDLAAGGGGDDRVRGGRGDDLVLGGDGNDRVTGGRGDDEIVGGDGSDRLRGGQGSDLLEGQNGDDLLNGGGGNDFLIGGAGADQLIGGRGADTFAFDDNVENGRDRILDFELGIDQIGIRNGVFGDLVISDVPVPMGGQNAFQGAALVEFSTGSALIDGIRAAELTVEDFLFAA